jgi:hypothetical protein
MFEQARGRHDIVEKTETVLGIGLVLAKRKVIQEQVLNAERHRVRFVYADLWLVQVFDFRQHPECFIGEPLQFGRLEYVEEEQHCERAYAVRHHAEVGDFGQIEHAQFDFRLRRRRRFRLMLS